MRIELPDVCLVVLVGASSSGKSTFARQNFRPSEVLSSDRCRLMVADDENDQAATEAAFDVLHYIAGRRLALGRLTVVDATNLEERSRVPLLALAEEHNVSAVAVLLDIPMEVCEQRNARRDDRELTPEALKRQFGLLKRARKDLPRAGFRHVYTLRGAEQVDRSTVERFPPPTDRSDEHGPFDIVGDVHGCLDELVSLLTELGYDVAPDRAAASHPDGRQAVFLGDLVDRGPDTPGVLRLVKGMVEAGTALCVPGNHESKLVRALKGHDVSVGHGLAESLEQLAECPEDFIDDVVRFVEGLESHVVLDGGKLVVAHAGLPEHMHNRVSRRVLRFALYGDTTGETDALGLPVRYPWAKDYRGSPMVVYGHTPVDTPEWVNNTICIDTACVFGGSLTALRYPEKETVSVPAVKVHYGPGRSFPPDAVDARWLVYLPPRLPPGPASQRADLLEHPEEVFSAYKREGVEQVVCEYMHGGNRAVAIVCRDPAAAQRRFDMETPAGGVVHDRTGRPFFPDPAQEVQALQALRDGLGMTSLWEELGTDWLALDLGVVCPEGQDGNVDSPLLAPFTILAAESGVHALRERVWHLDRMERLASAVSHTLLPTRYKLVDLEDVISQAEGIAWWQDLTAAGGEGMVVRPLPGSAEPQGGSEAADAADGPGPDQQVQPGFQCRGPRSLRRVYGPDYSEPENLARLRQRDLDRVWTLALQEHSLGIDGLQRFLQGAAMDEVHECVLGVLILSTAR